MPITLFPHQLDAINAWEDAGRKGILSMATGTGKTYTAIGAIDQVMQFDDRVLTVISVPYAHLIPQWKKSIENYDLEVDEIIEVHAENHKWKNTLELAVVRLITGRRKRVIVITTHDSLVNDKMKHMLSYIKNDMINTLLVGDEVHGLGSESRRSMLQILPITYKLGLSATPHRLWDEPGTSFLFSYFGSIVYEFPLSRAVTEINPATGYTYLTPYEYHPIFVNLTLEELRRYEIITDKIIKMLGGIEINAETLSSNEYLKRLLIKRANIIKNAENKMKAFTHILDSLKKISHLLVYVSETGKGSQLEEVLKILKDRDINAKRFTMELSNRSVERLGFLSEREYILKKFDEGEIQALVAMKILDEGVDVPSARYGILMASTTSPRQYIQRLGRILRRAPGKDLAHIYDVIVIPDTSRLNKTLEYIERSILCRELRRYYLISESAVNAVEALKTIDEIKRKMGVVDCG